LLCCGRLFVRAMASLADRVLGFNDDEDELEDPDLARQLAELQARRAARGGGTAPLAVPVPEEPEEPLAAVDAEPAAASAAPKPKSLADQILAGSGGDELEAMEQELEAQLSQYRKQRDTPAGSRGKEIKEDLAAESAAPAADAKGRAEAQRKPGAAKPPPAPVPPAQGEADTTAPADEAAAAPVTEEDAALAALRQEAASMDVAFPGRDDPAAVEAAKAAPKAKPKREGTWKSSRDSDRKEAPVPDDVLELQSLLNDVDTRLQGIQDRHAMTERQATLGDHASAEGTRAITALQAQNAHLRDRLADPKTKGLLALDRSVFGLSEAKQEST